jgi:uncharacterized DUF497 family protein
LARSGPPTTRGLKQSFCSYKILDGRFFWVAVGANVRGVIVVVFAQLGREGVSIISMRPASRNERKLYEER